jgi:hypothetical protein
MESTKTKTAGSMRGVHVVPGRCSAASLALYPKGAWADAPTAFNDVRSEGASGAIGVMLRVRARSPQRPKCAMGKITIATERAMKIVRAALPKRAPAVRHH